jgi:ABC-type phosphate transport system substrate-binding protein
MPTRRRLLVSGVVMLASPLLFPVLCAQAGPGAEQLAVVVAKDSAVDGLSLHELKRVYLGDNVQGPGGQKLLALNRETKGAERIGFDRSVLNMSPDVVARYWIDRKIRGQSAAPKAVDPASVIQKVVARLPGAIGYVRVHDLTADVKILRIDGKKPGDAGYAIFADGQARAQAAYRHFTL